MQNTRKSSGFPLSFAQERLNKKDAIIDGLKTRLNHDIDQEIEIGINQILKICELRMKDVIAQNSKSNL